MFIQSIFPWSKNLYFLFFCFLTSWGIEPWSSFGKVRLVMFRLSLECLVNAINCRPSFGQHIDTSSVDIIQSNFERTNYIPPAFLDVDVWVPKGSIQASLFFSQRQWSTSKTTNSIQTYVDDSSLHNPLTFLRLPSFPNLII